MLRLSLALIATLFLGFVASPATTFAQDNKTLEERLDEIDITDPDQLFEVANWAMKNKKSSKIRKEGRKLMKEVLDLDEDHEAARAAFGHVRVGEKWYKTKKAANKAKLKLLEAEMKEKGYVKFRNGFIKKLDKKKWKSNWEKDDGLIWRSYEEIMRGKGFQLYQGEWLKVSKNDIERSARHTKLTGEDIVITTTEHFVIHLQVPVGLVKRYSELAEQLLDWFYKEFNLGALVSKKDLFPRKPHLWGFNSPQQFQDWVTTYSEDYRFSKAEKEQFRKNPSGWLLGGKCISTFVNEQPERMENPMLHQLASLIVGYFTGHRDAPWMSEALGNLAEHHLSREKYGYVNMSTLSRYAEGGGIASKAFTTRDFKPQVRGLVKRGEHISVIQLSLLPLNALNQDHLAQGYSHIEWLYNHKREGLVKWLQHLRTGNFMGAPQKQEQQFAFFAQQSIKHAFDWTPDEFMKNWEQYVLKNYR